METLSLFENVEQTEDNIKEEFKDAIDSKMAVKLNYEKKTVDYTWLDVFEESMRYIDNILRNPKKFIINDEEIVKVELARKVTVESIIHLTQHTNLIQDIDPVTGDVQPSKILNINKEESLDTYENRFVYTLIKQMNYVMNLHEADINSTSYLFDTKEVDYNASVALDNENVNISIKLNSDIKQNDNNNKKNGVSIQDRYKKVKIQMAGFMNSELMQTLTKLHVPDVRPPIRKTNAILKNPNFQKATEVWNFLQSYNNKDSHVEKDDQEYMETGIYKEKFDESFMINYLILNSLSNSSNKSTKSKVMNMTIGKIIETVLDNDEDITKEKFYELINKEYEKAIEIINRRDNIITKMLLEKLSNVDNQINDAVMLLR